MIRKSLLLLALLAPALAAATPTPDTVLLPDIEVQGERAPLDSQRPRFARLVPCLGCEAERASIDSLAYGILEYVLLPSEPADRRGVTPVSMTRPELRADKLP